MIDGSRLLVSIAAAELTQHDIPGSLMTLDDIRASPISAELSAGLTLLEQACAGADTPITVVTRPEIFTHGATLTWLREQTGDARHHLCFSDGCAARVLPGLNNHVFFYRGDLARCAAAFLDLRRRAAELLCGFRTQVNTAYVFDRDTARRPATTLLMLTDPEPSQPELLPFAVGSSGLETDVERLSNEAPVDLATLPTVASLLYVALDEVALNSQAFMAGLANAMMAAYFHRDRHIVLQAPFPDRQTAEVKHRLNLLLGSLRHHMPFLPVGQPSNIFIHLAPGQALPAPLFGGQSRIVAHEAHRFWHASPGFYARFQELSLLRDERSVWHKASHRAVLSKLTSRVWTEATLPRASDGSLARYFW